MPGMVSYLPKRSGMASNVLKRWQGDFPYVKKAEG
jgi:hypothetical protein